MKNRIIAHRGASKYAPENTMPAFQLAYDMQAEGIETDVQLTKDGIPILIHDETLHRTTGVKGFVKNYTLEEIQKLDAGSYFSPKFNGSKLITLEEFLGWACNKSLYVNLELKNNKIDYKDLESKVLDLLEKYQLKEQTTISSFSSKSVKRMRELDSNMDVALLRSRRHEDLTGYAVSLGASSLHINYRLLTHQLIEESKNRNLPLRVYTVNRRGSIMKCLKRQCDGIITDVPDRVLKIRQKFNL